ARDRAGSAIRELLNLAPAIALRLDDLNQPHEVPVSQVQQGDRLLVRPGDRIPVDGVVIEGESEVDESMISGEPLPVHKTIGDEAIAGTTNQNGRLSIKATKVGAQTALAQIVQLVESDFGIARRSARSTSMGDHVCTYPSGGHPERQSRDPAKLP